MHPEIYRELTSQRGREMREQAHRAAMARVARQMLRAMRHGIGAQGGADGFIAQAIPDYVDGWLPTLPSGDGPGTPDPRGVLTAQMSRLAISPVVVGPEEQAA